MNNNLSWIKLHRKSIESPLWKYAINANFLILIPVWFFILLSANFEEKKWYDGNQEVTIPAGSFVTSVSHLGGFFGVSRQTIRTCLKHLECMNMVTIKATNKWTLIYVVNWSKYQLSTNDDNQRTTNEQPTANQRLTTTKEYKNIKNNTITNVDSVSQKVEKPEKHITFLEEIPDADIPYYEKYTDATARQIRSVAEDITLYCDSKGKKYSNYKMALIQWLKRKYPKDQVKTMAEANGYMTPEEAKAKGVYF